ncbi:head-tail connector protein [Croceicoccus naphthovorans]|uniref:Uncharacterized protein n=1 Tax=Croceicoccus naphthovorans TaxID=1348774 RepID=A0A0G3XDM0_9SPHN|nr:phage head-tail connector protein [Croceicoccus naphthovorans]AKM09287.1 hypothetical protein AB433_03710 [Croceicoccus naphthovorans]MBB3990186.1 putative phiE125 gp8 family phage protein [Croceicoccus naphthovorans]
MKRAVLAPADLPASAIAELKVWLGINTTREDALLGSLLSASLDICEAYTGVRPILATCEEVWPVRPIAFTVTGWQSLSTRPIETIEAVDAIALDGTRTALSEEAYEIDLDADGTGRFRMVDVGSARRVAVRFTAGLANDWDSLPDAIRQGVMRLAAHHHRMRDTGGGDTVPPRAVVALWQPWRRMRIA